MRTHGWAGAIPETDEDAASRIIDAATRRLAQDGLVPRIADIARDLGVSRPTVYRYFADADALVAAVAVRESGPFVAELAASLAGERDPARAVVRSVLYVVDHLHDHAGLALALTANPSRQRIAEVTASPAQDFGLEMLRSLEVDWAAAGFDERRMRQLIEHMLRLVQSFVVDPGHPARHGADLDGYLQTWLAPCIEAIARTASVVPAAAGRVDPGLS